MHRSSWIASVLVVLGCLQACGGKVEETSPAATDPGGARTSANGVERFLDFEKAEWNTTPVGPLVDVDNLVLEGETLWFGGATRVDGIWTGSAVFRVGTAPGSRPALVIARPRSRFLGRCGGNVVFATQDDEGSVIELYDEAVRAFRILPARKGAIQSVFIHPRGIYWSVSSTSTEGSWGLTAHWSADDDARVDVTDEFLDNFAGDAHDLYFPYFKKRDGETVGLYALAVGKRAEQRRLLSRSGAVADWNNFNDSVIGTNDDEVLSQVLGSDGVARLYAVRKDGAAERVVMDAPVPTELVDEPWASGSKKVIYEPRVLAVDGRDAYWASSQPNVRSFVVAREGQPRGSARTLSIAPYFLATSFYGIHNQVIVTDCCHAYVAVYPAAILRVAK